MEKGSKIFDKIKDDEKISLFKTLLGNVSAGVEIWKSIDDTKYFASLGLIELTETNKRDPRKGIYIYKTW
jgi:hypothetical protein